MRQRAEVAVYLDCYPGKQGGGVKRGSERKPVEGTEVHEKAAVVGIGLSPTRLPEDCIECALKSWEAGVFV